jgi:hypothetical protein
MGAVLSGVVGFVGTLVGAMVLRALVGPKWTGAILITMLTVKTLSDLYSAQQSGNLTGALPQKASTVAGGVVALSYTSVFSVGLAQLGMR